jgi:GAF domain-containing protein
MDTASDRGHLVLMTHAFNPQSLAQDRAERYAQVLQEIGAVLAGEANLTARMATVACMLANSFEHYFWTGFYIVDPQRPDELVVGPYQGTLGCLRIAFGRGVCGAAALTGQTQLVADVHAFPGHIACDGRSQSEIVVPVRDAAGRLIAVFDVDSDQPAAFNAADKAGLEAIVTMVFAAD